MISTLDLGYGRVNADKAGPARIRTCSPPLAGCWSPSIRWPAV